MAKQMFRVLSVRQDEKTGKSRWTKIGVAFPRDNGGMSVLLDALPLGREVMIMPDDREPAGNQAPQQNPDADDVPY